VKPVWTYEEANPKGFGLYTVFKRRADGTLDGRYFNRSRNAARQIADQENAEPHAAEVLRCLEELYEHCVDNVPYFPSSAEREGEDEIVRRIERVLKQVRGDE
jgi:hypothetical protein